MVRRYVTLASQHIVVQHRKFSPMDRVVAASRRRIARAYIREPVTMLLALQEAARLGLSPSRSRSSP